MQEENFLSLVQGRDHATSTPHKASDGVADGKFPWKSLRRAKFRGLAISRGHGSGHEPELTNSGSYEPPTI